MSRTFDFGTVQQVTEEEMRAIFSRVADAVVNGSHLAEQVQALTERVNGLSDSYNVAIAHNVELSTKVEELQGKVRYLENVRQSAEIALEHQAQRLADLNLKVEQQGEAIAAKDDRINVLVMELEQTVLDNQHKNTTIQSLLEQRDEHRATIERQQAEINELGNRLGELGSRHADVTGHRDRLHAERDNAFTQINELILERDNLRENTVRYTEEIERWRIEFEAQASDLERARHDNAGLQRDLTSILEELGRTRREHREEVAKLQDMVKEANQRCDKAMVKLDKIHSVLEPEPPQVERIDQNVGNPVPEVERTPLPQVNWREPSPTVIVAEDDTYWGEPTDYPPSAA